jgi:uncharacterized protein (TIGR02599 family)
MKSSRLSSPHITPLHGKRCAFTLVELLLSMTVLAVLMLVITQVIGMMQKSWSQSNTRISQFREARIAFDLLTRNLTQATLNTYWETDQGGLAASGVVRNIPTRYIRKSELQFICGKAVDLVVGASSKTQTDLPYHSVFFQAPLGVTQSPNYDSLTSLLCGRGYFVQYGDDAAFRPGFVTQQRLRYRLMEYSPNTEQNFIYNIYKNAPGNPVALRDWFKDAGAAESRTVTSGATRGFTRPIAENIVMLIIAPRVSKQQAGTNSVHSIAPAFQYDSAALPTGSSQGTQHLLPPMLDILMIAIDEASAFLMTPSVMTELQAKAPFTDASKFDLGSVNIEGTDIAQAEALLVDKKINYRVFSATIELRGSRWSL